MRNLLKMSAVISGLIFMCISCQQTGHNAEKSKNPAMEFADKLLKARKDAKEAVGATEQSQKDVNKAIEEIDKDHKDK